VLSRARIIDPNLRAEAGSGTNNILEEWSTPGD
jgi:hypothetical protein